MAIPPSLPRGMYLPPDITFKCAELVNKELDKITAKITPDMDIEVVLKSLCSVKEPLENHPIADNLKEHVYSIKKLVDDPFIFVQTKAQVEPLKVLVNLLVDKKIRDIATKIDLVNSYLDSIPVKTEVEFEVVKEALRSITEPKADHTIPENLTGHIKAIKELIDDPSMFVEKPEHYGEFQSCVLTGVAERIKRLEVLKTEEKEKIIQKKEKSREVTAKQQETMTERKPPVPGSEAHTISYDQMLHERYAAEDAHARGQLAGQMGARAVRQIHPQLADQQNVDAQGGGDEIFTRLVGTNAQDIRNRLEMNVAIAQILLGAAEILAQQQPHPPSDPALLRIYNEFIAIIPNDRTNRLTPDELLQLTRLGNDLRLGMGIIRPSDEVRNLQADIAARVQQLIGPGELLPPALLPFNATRSAPTLTEEQQRTTEAFSRIAQGFTGTLWNSPAPRTQEDDEDLYSDGDQTVEVEQEIEVEREIEIERHVSNPSTVFRTPVANPDLIAFYRTVISILPDDRTTPLNSEERDTLRMIVDFLNMQSEILVQEAVRREYRGDRFSREDITRIEEIQDFLSNLNRRMRELFPFPRAEAGTVNPRQDVNFPPPPPPSASGEGPDVMETVD